MTDIEDMARRYAEEVCRLKRERDEAREAELDAEAETTAACAERDHYRVGYDRMREALVVTRQNISSLKALRPGVTIWDAWQAAVIAALAPAPESKSVQRRLAIQRAAPSPDDLADAYFAAAPKRARKLESPSGERGATTLAECVSRTPMTGADFAAIMALYRPPCEAAPICEEECEEYRGEGWADRECHGTGTRPADDCPDPGCTGYAEKFAACTRPAAPGPLEALAALAHEQWSGWMRYLFEKCHGGRLDDGEVAIPRWAVERWGRQVATPYEHLSEDEKESDRKEARRVLEVLGLRTRPARGDKA